MQNFLPYADFEKSASVLDGRRLVKQFTETKQCLDVLCGFSDGWKNHPAVTAWRGHILSLLKYASAVGNECGKRGYKNRNSELAVYYIWCQNNNCVDCTHPAWFDNESLHSSHRSRLLCKGEIDALCDAIKKHFKFKKIDDWCKEHFKLTKNALRYEHVATLKKICVDNGIKVGNNFYSQYGWTDDPSKNYVWAK